MKQQVVELPNFFSKRKDMRFVFNDDGLVLMNDSEPDTIVEVPVDQIKAFRFGVNWIRGYAFTYGRQYLIEIKDRDDYVITIKFSSFYGIRREKYNEAYLSLIKAIWDHYFAGQATHYLNMFNLKLSFDLCDISISTQGVKWDKAFVEWEKLKISNYRTYFMLHHADIHLIQNPFYFKSDWNAYLLQAVLLTIVRNNRPGKFFDF